MDTRIMRDKIKKGFVYLMGFFKKPKSKPKSFYDGCPHSLKWRVMTHRGYHCNNCGKRF